MHYALQGTTNFLEVKKCDASEWIGVIATKKHKQ